MLRIKSKNYLALLYFVFFACVFLLIFNSAQTAYADGDNETVPVSVRLEETGQGTNVFHLKISVNNAVAGETYDIWTKTNMALHESALNTSAIIWGKQTLTTDSTAYIADYQSMQINGYYEILTKGDANAEFLYTKVSVSDTQPHIESLTINGKELTEVNYLPAGVDAEFLFSGNASVYALKDAEDIVSTANGKISHEVRNGEYSVYVKADGGEYTKVVLHGYNAVEDYTVIDVDSVKINNSKSFGESVYMGETAQISLTTNSIGQGSTVFARLKINGASYNFTDGLNTEYNFSDYELAYGVYIFTIELINSNSGLVEDSYITYYNYSRNYDSENRAVFTPSYTENSDGGYDFTITDIQNLSENDLYFRIVKWDMRGEYAINSWTIYSGKVDNIIKFSVKGNYILETQVKVGDSGKTFEVRSYSHLGSVQYPNDNFLVSSTSGTPVEDDYFARVPYILKADTEETAQMYKFVVSGVGFYYREEFFSPTNNFVWVANKGGTYNISVRLLGANSYGYAEKIISREIIVKNSDERATAQDGEIENFGDKHSADNVSGAVSEFWLSEYTDTDGITASGVIKLDFTNDWASLYIKPRQTETDYAGYEYLALRMLITDTNNNVEYLNFAPGGVGEFIINDLVKDKWHTYYLHASAFLNNYQAFATSKNDGGRLLFKSEKNGVQYSVYIDEIYLAKRTEIESGEVEMFSDAGSVASIRNQGDIKGVTWIDEYAGAEGVIKVDFDYSHLTEGNGWPAIPFIARQSASAYEGYNKVRIKLYIDDPDNTLLWLCLNTAPTIEDWDGTLKKGEWMDYDVDIQTFLDNINDLRILGATGWGKAYSVYIDSIYMY